ncbi:MAG: hypothetical protein ACRDTG_15800 [Pseudonocardiaceae bacterium]
MRFDLTDTAFCESAATWLAGLNDENLRDLEVVFAISPGYYPTTLHRLWQVEVSRRGLSPRMAARFSQSGKRIPVCHPHDCDWRFTTDTAAELVDRVASHLEQPGCIAHIGTPSTFRAGLSLHPQHRHVLLERNAAMTAALADDAAEVVTLDLALHDPPKLKANAAILDPPWYVHDTLIFLWAASRVCHHGTLIWLCQPTLATRPGIAEERMELLGELFQLGFEEVHTFDHAVRYQMPHFEAMSLRLTATELAVPPNWRKGDLLVLRKVGPASITRPLAVSEQWTEVHFGPVRIKLRATDQVEDLANLVPDDVLSTVSRRDPVRGKIGLWTSGNRVYGLAAPERVGRLITLCDNDLEAMRFTLARTLLHARRLGMSTSTARQLFDVLLVELQEHNTWKDSV